MSFKLIEHSLSFFFSHCTILPNAIEINILYYLVHLSSSRIFSFFSTIQTEYSRSCRLFFYIYQYLWFQVFHCLKIIKIRMCTQLTNCFFFVFSRRNLNVKWCLFEAMFFVIMKDLTILISRYKERLFGKFFDLTTYKRIFIIKILIKNNNNRRYRRRKFSFYFFDLLLSILYLQKY